MKKGKFGIVLCFYPIAAFAAVILNAPIICFALAAAAIFIERDEWAGRQTLQAWMVSALVYFFDKVARTILSVFHLPFLSGFFSAVSTIVFVLVYLAAILFSILAIIRVSKGGEANVPVFSELAYRVFGAFKPKPVRTPPPYAPYDPSQPYGAPPMPQQQNQQQPYPAPYPPQGYANQPAQQQPTYAPESQDKPAPPPPAN